ncbi:hypothetical protein [Methylomonas sp. AM2-LC]|uniref:hypothetical protein n=1 Tax=Methylomonas sp. AM2-LC TaxID=3153301 RepID=UPI0032636016
MLDTHPRTQLCFMLEQYGRVLINEPKRCRGMLKDLAPHHTRETNLLITALEQKIAEELLKQNPLISVDMQIERLAKRLHDNLGTQLEFAFWAVESWALALNIIQQPTTPKQNELIEEAYREAEKFYEQKEYDKAFPLEGYQHQAILAAEKSIIDTIYPDEDGVHPETQQATRQKLLKLLREGKLDDKEILVDPVNHKFITSHVGTDKYFKMPIRDLLKMLQFEEYQKLTGQD